MDGSFCCAFKTTGNRIELEKKDENLLELNVGILPGMKAC